MCKCITFFFSILSVLSFPFLVFCYLVFSILNILAQVSCCTWWRISIGYKPRNTVFFHRVYTLTILSYIIKLLSELLTSLCSYIFLTSCPHFWLSNVVFINLRDVKCLSYVCVSVLFVSCLQFLDQQVWLFHIFNHISKFLCYEWLIHSPYFFHSSSVI